MATAPCPGTTETCLGGCPFALDLGAAVALLPSSTLSSVSTVPGRDNGTAYLFAGNTTSSATAGLWPSADADGYSVAVWLQPAGPG